MKKSALSISRLIALAPAFARWRKRMKTKKARSIYRERAATAETVHGDLRKWRGLAQLPVRGQAKVRAFALLHALTYNLIRLEALKTAA